MELGRGGTLVARTARRLSDISAAVEDGAFLGSEDELLTRLEISRPTLRQAAKIAESEGMVSVRRGTRGGFYAARPRVADAIRSLNRYLRLRGATIRDLAQIGGAMEDATLYAAGCTDPDLRDALQQVMEDADQCLTARGMMDLDVRFARILAEMTGNPVIETMIEMSYAFGLQEQGIYLYDTQDQRDQGAEWIRTIGQAVMAGDGELARFLMARRLVIIRGWIAAAEEPRLLPINQI